MINTGNINYTTYKYHIRTLRITLGGNKFLGEVKRIIKLKTEENTPYVRTP